MRLFSFIKRLFGKVDRDCGDWVVVVRKRYKTPILIDIGNDIGSCVFVTCYPSRKNLQKLTWRDRK